jgi:hypothetical protein
MFINTTKARIVYIIQLVKIVLFILPALTFTGIAIYALTGNPEFMDYIVVYILFAIPFDFLVISSIMKIMLLSKAKLYEKVFLMDKDGFIEIQKLATNVNTKEDKVVKELTDLIKMDVIRKIAIQREGLPKILLDNGKAPKEVEYETVICPSCAAKVTKIVGKIGKCDYCGNDIM